MWLQQTFYFILSGIITGSLSASWDMAVSPVVFVPRGEDVVLPCSFTHPRQQRYSGMITLKWLARESNALPFLTCSVRNESMEGKHGCAESELKYSTYGDLRRGELSLLIRRVQLGDNGTFFCRVELDRVLQYIQKETQLYVTVQPQILNMSVVEPGSDGAPRRLQCEVEGQPLPNVTWLSASGTPMRDLDVKNQQSGPARLLSSVPYLQEVLSCRAESRLGVAERRHPATHSTTLIISVIVSGLIVLLLLGTGCIAYRRNRARAAASPIYENAETVENHRLQDSDRPVGGSVELQLVYSTLNDASSSQHASVKKPVYQQEESVVLYSPVNVNSD
ncbi:sialic acid-binding Ig-like lectin 15 [Gymnodraco acuticeps]|uniref:Sialic acid-binding Ig-like lectin 15 n=1 Tax=Gymnodraco acuticeps TaxID=8218 RepID=A0A6P8UAF7_GYMAC|nr:sialic acid-binding Ig-like lectin 15 [Gymnodraco acuticeps]